MRGLTRRHALGLLAGAFARPALALDEGFAPALTLARHINQLHSIVIAWKGEVHAAEAFRGPSLDTPVNVKSVSKSLVSTLAGAAVERGEIDGIDTPVAPFLKRTIPRRADKRVRTITFEHLLAMQSGLTPFAGSTYGAWTAGDHWIYQAFAAPMQADPGTVRLYSTANTHILGTALANAAGMDLWQLANERIGGPLDLRLDPWTKDPQGNYLGGNDMRVSPMGLMRYGEAYRQDGMWQNERLTSPDWIAQSWEPRTMADVPNHQYGLSWFLWDVDGVRVNYARGYGGQMVYVVPQRQLTVVMTSDSTRPARVDGHLKTLHALFSGAVLPVTRPVTGG
ncbi:serine hydrolase domain-containing protein [Oceaniglobus indicus]|uniref:serine hydrolase domain-containing protein n=1 Tax=Oceaniglobus indicus TaxID=2047749 RepID=UPI000C19D26E|nr:serine hydrolase [Oceaniglobus indicus]